MSTEPKVFKVNDRVRISPAAILEYGGTESASKVRGTVTMVYPAEPERSMPFHCVVKWDDGEGSGDLWETRDLELVTEGSES